MRNPNQHHTVVAPDIPVGMEKTGMDEFASATGVSGMTNVRWRIFFLILGTVAINYIDRASLSVAMPISGHEFKISPAIQGVLLSSFFWSYCLMQIPGGLLADRFLPRSVIAGATIFWGGFAALAAATTGWITMLLTRIGLGLAEGPIYPAGAKLIGMWMTPTERGRAAALLDGGAPLGTALGSLIIAGLIAALDSWRAAFLVAGLATMACGAFAWFYIRNHPHEHDSVNHEERSHIQDGLASFRGRLTKRCFARREFSVRRRSGCCSSAGFVSTPSGMAF